ncbi:MAG: antibiotic biosynthesis monooxygenase [Flavobacteriales bacterium]|nr:antibiotic biosynthesis monooxygenase [Flavobacteriales bacterium]
MATQVIVSFIAKEGIVDGLQNQLVDTVKNHTPSFDGFISAVVHRDLANPNRLVIMEEWESAEDFNAYLDSYSEEEKAKMGENLAGPPDVKILDVSLN